MVYRCIHIWAYIYVYIYIRIYYVYTVAIFTKHGCLSSHLDKGFYPRGLCMGCV